MASNDVLIERLLRVIDEGRRTATYKLALLLALIDAAATRPGESEIPTRAIAERVVELYYPQTRAFVDSSGVSHQTRQISMKSSAALAAVGAFRRAADEIGACRFHAAKSALPEHYEATVDSVEDTFVRYPIPLMQVVGASIVPFLYSVDWPEGASVKQLRARGDDRVRLLDGVADRIAVLGPMLRPLIELHWTRDVARWTRIPMEDELLHEHLFGSERVAFPKSLVGHLRDLQSGECFYCGDTIGKRVEVDHFLAWSRWPNDAIENLVVADSCNGAKSDHIAATAHLVRWRFRVETLSADLVEIATSTGWASAGPRTLALAQTTYSHLAAGTPLWVRAKEFELADGPITFSADS